MTMPWPALDDTLLAQAAQTFNFRLGHPIPLAVTRDGSVLFRRTPPRAFTSDLYELAPDGTIRTLFALAAQPADEHLSDAEKARRERTRTATRGIVDVDVSADGTRVMFALGSTVYVIERGATIRTIAAVDLGPVYDPHLAPDGTAIAFVRDGDLWLHALAGDGVTTRLTTHAAGFEHGVADFAAQEELGRTRGFWWSPDSQRIAFERVDARAVDTIYVSNARHPETPPVPFKYPRAGTNNAIVDLGVVDVRAGEPVAPTWITWDRRFCYLVSVDWHAAGHLTAVVVDRDQTDAAMLAIDAATGAVRTLVHEHDDAWLNFDAGKPRWLDDGSGFLWMTEARGAWTLELRAPTGELVRVLTTPELGLRRLVNLDASAAIVLASADPLRQHVLRVPLDGAAPTRLDVDDGDAFALADQGVVVITTQLAGGGERTIAVRADGTHAELPSVGERPVLEPTTTFETVLLDGRTHHVAITRPRAFDAHRRYPVLLKVYAGPHRAYVTSARDGYIMDQWYADAGFIVVRSDGRGTPNRGRAWERAILRDLITVPLADQIGALRAVGARHPELDLARVGVFGWSFGGYFATLAAELHPEVFACAIAGAPVTDWTLYDTAYTERYMKTPAANPAGYAATSALTHAAKLTRPLLVIHGITDDNVHFAHALALIEALYLAGKRAEVITLSATHMVPDPRLNLLREQVQVDFFRQHLGG
ncbi:MAG: DPP IV N-terminal domain-containing protein [Proteobacteria bacterium]|nr:DPP IV N-terminal domain-containing protein [Pseudomonadota bacterium]